jgi:hypothetical protein
MVYSLLLSHERTDDRKIMVAAFCLMRDEAEHTQASQYAGMLRLGATLYLLVKGGVTVELNC